MSSSRVTLRCYRALVHLYRKSFRDEYGPDLVGLVADQLRDEPAWRVSSRCTVDLALTLPSRHLEAHMDRSPSLAVPAVFAAIALSAVAVAIVVGSPLVFFVCLAVAVTAIGLGLVALHRVRPLTEAQPVSDHWWKLLLGGTCLLAGLIAVTTATGELSEGAWFFAMTTLLLAVVLIGGGIVLGIAHLVGRPRRGFAG